MSIVRNDKLKNLELDDNFLVVEYLKETHKPLLHIHEEEDNS